LDSSSTMWVKRLKVPFDPQCDNKKGKFTMLPA
jgi:hypothetical protein